MENWCDTLWCVIWHFGVSHDALWCVTCHTLVVCHMPHFGSLSHATLWYVTWHTLMFPWHTLVCHTTLFAADFMTGLIKKTFLFHSLMAFGAPQIRPYFSSIFYRALFFSFFYRVFFDRHITTTFRRGKSYIIWAQLSAFKKKLLKSYIENDYTVWVYRNDYPVWV